MKHELIYTKHNIFRVNFKEIFSKNIFSKNKNQNFSVKDLTQSDWGNLKIKYWILNISWRKSELALLIFIKKSTKFYKKSTKFYKKKYKFYKKNQNFTIFKKLFTMKKCIQTFGYVCFGVGFFLEYESGLKKCKNMHKFHCKKYTFALLVWEDLVFFCTWEYVCQLLLH